MFYTLFKIECFFFGDITRSTLYLTSRVFVGILGSATILLTYLVGRKLYNEKVGMVASILLAFIPLAVRDSHYATVDIPVTFFIVLAFLSILYVMKYGTTKFYLISGSLIGLAASTKYNGGLLILSLSIAFVISSYKKLSGKKLIPISEIKKLLYAYFMSLIAFILTTPYSVLDFKTFMKDLLYEMEHMKKGHGVLFIDTPPGYIYHLQESLNWGLTTYVEIVSIIGIIYILAQIILRTDKKEVFSGVMLLSWIIPYYLIIGSWETKFMRYVIPLLPFLSISAAYFIYKISFLASNMLQSRGFTSVNRFVLNIFLILSISVLIINPILATIRIDEDFLKKDTRQVSLNWIDQNVPNGSVVFREQYTPEVELLGKYKVKFYGGRLANTEITEIVRADYLIISSGMYGRYYAHPNHAQKQIAFYDSLNESLQLIKDFYPNETIRGPVIKIYYISESVRAVY